MGAAHSVASCAGIWAEAARAGVEEKWGEVTVAAVSRKPKYTGVWPFRGCASPKVQIPAPVLPVTLENGCHLSEPQCSSSEKWDSNSRLIELWESMIDLCCKGNLIWLLRASFPYPSLFAVDPFIHSECTHNQQLLLPGNVNTCNLL